MSVEQVKVIITRQDGGVTVLSIILDDGHGLHKDLTTELIQREVLRAEEEPIEWAVITDDDIPQDRTYRNAWKAERGTIVHDMDRARNIHLEKIRFSREGELFQLDKEWMKHMGRGNKKEADAIEAKRERLRNITDEIAPAVAAAIDIDELKQTWPVDVLPPHPLMFSVDRTISMDIEG